MEALEVESLEKTFEIGSAKENLGITMIFFCIFTYQLISAFMGGEEQEIEKQELQNQGVNPLAVVFLGAVLHGLLLILVLHFLFVKVYKITVKASPTDNSISFQMHHLFDRFYTLKYAFSQMTEVKARENKDKKSNNASYKVHFIFSN